jgi:site-specific DNA recombinase
MTRVALYARYSDDKQNPASIEDQLNLCREHADREGWRIFGTYKDPAISGASVILRPGVQSLLEDARAGQFDIVLAEALDRISRDQADTATLYKHFLFAGVRIVTLGEGEISELHVGLKGTMNALFLKDLAKKTHRGLKGRVEKGKSGGGLCYGYDVVRQLDSRGQLVRGDRAINEAQATIIRRIFSDYAAGSSPIAIARRLNAEGVSGPGGAPWGGTTIRGHAKRGTGFINNELYIGRLVWNRQRYLKDPETGKRVARLNAPSDMIVTEVPHLRIVSDELWGIVKARQAQVMEDHAAVIAGIREHFAGRPVATRRPSSLLSGLVFCGCCSGPMTLRRKGRFACSRRVDHGDCDNHRTVDRHTLEDRVLDGLKDRMMAPEIAAEAMRAYAEEMNRLHRDRYSAQAEDRRELGKIRKAIASIVTAIENGEYSRTLGDRLRGLEEQEDALNARLSLSAPRRPALHPNIGGIYRQRVARLRSALDTPESHSEAADAIRELIERITLKPGAGRGQVDVVVQGDLGVILNWLEQRSSGQNTNTPGAKASGVSLRVGAGAGFEPATFRL